MCNNTVYCYYITCINSMDLGVFTQTNAAKRTFNKRAYWGHTDDENILIVFP